MELAIASAAAVSLLKVIRTTITSAWVAKKD